MISVFSCLVNVLYGIVKKKKKNGSYFLRNLIFLIIYRAYLHFLLGFSPKNIRSSAFVRSINSRGFHSEFKI